MGAGAHGVDAACDVQYGGSEAGESGRHLDERLFFVRVVFVLV